MRCLHCDKPLPGRPGPGRKQQFCDATCRSAARRRREAVKESLTNEPVVGTLEAIEVAHRRVLEAQESLRAAVEAARARGRTWQEIGEVVGTTRQAAFQRFGRPLDPRTGAPMTPAGPTDAGDRALRLLGDCVAARFARVREEFDEAMLREISEERLAQVWAMVAGTVGSFERFGDPVVHAAGDLTAVHVLMHFEAGEATAQVAFRGSGEVAGFFIRPA